MDTFTCLAPILDMSVIDLDRQGRDVVWRHSTVPIPFHTEHYCALPCVCVCVFVCVCVCVCVV